MQSRERPFTASITTDLQPRVRAYTTCQPEHRVDQSPRAAVAHSSRPVAAEAIDLRRRAFVDGDNPAWAETSSGPTAASGRQRR